jgi:starch synthase
MARRVLSVASECVPLLKTGGLADVVGALPRALAGQGWQMRVLMPAYPGLAARLEPGAREVWAEPALFGGPGRVLEGRLGELDLLLLEAPHLYDRPGGPYGGPGGDFDDNADRFAALSWAAAQIAEHGLADGWRPEVLHCHDWQAGLAPAYLRFAGVQDVRSVMTVHNIAFQGLAPAWKLKGLRLPDSAFNADVLEYYGHIGALKAGLVLADAITTVSPSYARELMRPEFGMGLEGVIARRAAVVSGILNGIDTEVWSPEADPAIEPFSARRMAGKAKNRAALIQEFGLGEVPGPLAVIVSRLTGQKGLDLVPGAVEEFTGLGGGLVVLGSGDAQLEAALRAQADRTPGRIGVRIGYDEALSHRLFAGGDAVLVPSRFEPCGLTQMYGLRYGAVPLVSATGGLNDTVIDANPAALAAGVATGVVFSPVDALALEQALRRLVTLYDDRPAWRQMQRNGMNARLDWGASSAAYAALYESLTT